MLVVRSAEISVLLLGINHQSHFSFSDKHFFFFQTRQFTGIRQYTRKQPQLMAVSVQGPFNSKSSLWNMAGLPNHNYSGGIPNHISSIAYQYPTMNPGADQNMMPNYDHHMEPIRSHSPLHGQGQSPSNGELEVPSLSKSSKESKSKRSMSTPNIRTSSNSDAAALALVNDKRRNKLGYHRTSVACGHCRRRKIRCIPAPADPQNRCSNCIRLKKECNFYPVDQQPQPEPKRRGSKAQSGNGRASQSSSPSIPSGQLPDMQPNLPYHLNMPSIQNLGGAQVKTERTASFSPENKGMQQPSHRVLY